jgi:hypothetical protein
MGAVPANLACCEDRWSTPIRSLVIEDGRVVAQGRHHQLLARGGHYAQMWARQQAAPAAYEAMCLPLTPH